jgi:hypothetical protein
MLNLPHGGEGFLQSFLEESLRTLATTMAKWICDKFLALGYQQRTEQIGVDLADGTA